MSGLGVHSEAGRAEIAPTIDDVSGYVEEWARGRGVHFAKVVQIRTIAAIGSQRPTKLAKKTRFARS